jgi:hypothetical protein
MEALTFKSRREHRKDVHRFNRYIKGDNWDAEVSLYAKQLETQRLLPWCDLLIVDGKRILNQQTRQSRKLKSNSTCYLQYTQQITTS